MKLITILCCYLSIFIFPASANEHTLKILCWEGYAPEAYIQEFKQLVRQKYDINLNVIVNNISDPQEFFDQIRSKEADIISPSHHVPKSLKWRLVQNKLILPISLNNIPNFEQIIDELKQLPYFIHDGYHYGIPVVYGPYGLGYNKEEVKPPTSWQQLWLPKYKNKYAISSDYYEANIYITALALGYNKEQIFDYDLLRKNPNFHIKLKELAQNAKRYWVGVDRADEFEDLSLGTAWGFSFPELNERGHSWQMATPKEGTTGWVDVWSIGYSLKDKPLLKRIAEEWINFSISPKMQINYLRNIGQFPVNLSIASQLTEDEIKTYHLDEPSYFKDNLILWEVLDQRQQNGFRRMWENAKKKTEPPSNNSSPY